MTATLAFLEGTTALESVEPRPGRPIQPMQSAPVDDLDEAMFGETCVEWALTGLRLQAHRAGRTVSLFGYDGVTSVDITERLPRIADAVRGLPGDDLVLDGELSGADLPDPARVDVDRRVWFFDLLFDGDALLDRPLAHRRRALHAAVPEEMRLPSIETSDPAELERFLGEAQSKGRSGVVLKDLGSVYEPGQRGRSWRQFAPVHTLDLVVVAAEWGSGRRSDKLSRLHLAARTPAGEFITVGRTAVGVTDEMLSWQTERLLQLAVDEVDHAEVVAVRPEQVVEVAFDSVHEARRGGPALSLRAARVRRYRDDLRAAECDTIETVRALVQDDQRSPTPSADPTDVPRRRAEDTRTAPTDDAPRLPPARPPGLDAAQAEAAKRIREVLAERDVEPAPVDAEHPPAPAPAPPEGLPVSGYMRGHISQLDLDFAPYEEPELETGRTTHLLVMLVRFLTLGWAVALTTGALITRSETGPIDPSLVQTLGWFGIPIAIGLGVTGWAWSDRLTRNLRRLDGRLPSRLRCATAWATPVVTVAFLSLTVVQLEPTDVVDVRPSILVGVFAAVMWRPYSLIRRIFATLIRIRFDALLAAAYVLDLVAFGLLWWRLTVWSGGSEPITQGDVEILIGIGAAVAVALAVNVVVWRTIIRAGDRAEAHRAASQRTRYEHRMLRLRGVDPTDPEVWWALVQRRADEQRAAEEAAAAEQAAAEVADGVDGADGDVLVEAASPAATVVPTVEELVEDVKQKHSVAFRRLGEEQSDQLVDRLREQFTSVVGDLAGMPIETAPPGDGPPEEASGSGLPTETDEAAEQETDADDGDDAAESEASTASADLDEPVGPDSRRSGVPTSLLESLRRDDADADDESDADEEPLSILRSVVKRAGTPISPHTVDDDHDSDLSGDDSDDAPDTAASDESAAAPEAAPSGAGADLADAGPSRTGSERKRSPLERLAEEPGASREPVAGGSPLERLAARSSDDEPRLGKTGDIAARLEQAAASSDDADPVSALKRRLGLDETEEDVKSPLEQLLDQAGTVQVEAALAEHRQQEIEERPTERLVPPRLYALEWTRLLLVASFAVVTACGGWLVTESLGASGSSVDGNLGSAALDVDLARRAFVSAYSVAITLIPLWTFALLTYARRCGMDHAQPRRHLMLFAFSSFTCVLAFVLDGSVRGDTSALLLIPGALIAGAAGYLVEPARFWFDLPSLTLTIWTVAVPAMLGVAWVGGLLRPVDPLASLQLLAFFTVTVSLMSALITVLIALSASDIEDEIRLSPELAVPLSETGRGRS